MIPHSRRLGWVAPLLVVIANLGLSLPSSADEAENRKRLESMPRERRLTLAESLDKFDKLDSREQAEIRKLDADLARLDPVEAARYRQTLRNYHLWVNGLTDDQKKALNEASSAEERFNLATKFRRKDNENASKSILRISGIRIGEFGMIGPYEAAHLLRVWNTLTPAKQADLSKLQANKIREELRKRARNPGLGFEPYSFSTENETKYEAELDKDPNFKEMLGPLAENYRDKLDAAAVKLKAEVKKLRIEADNASKLAVDKKNAQTQTKANEANFLFKKAQEEAAHAAIMALNFRRRFEHPFAEFLYFEQNRPRPVLTKNFERFVTSTPPWFLEMLEPLSPDDARDYLTIVYRLLYEHPTEMPDPSKGKTDTPKPPQPPRPFTKQQAKKQAEFNPNPP